MRNFIAFLIGVTFAAFLTVPYAHAETISASADTVVISDLQTSYGGQSLFVGSSKFPTAIAWGQAVVASAENQSKANPKTAVTSCYPTSGNSYNTCSFSNENPSYPTSSLAFTVYASCATGSMWNGSDCVTVTYSCPAEGGWTLDGQTCTRVGCADKKGQTANSGYYDMGTNPNTPFPAIGCYGGCSAIFESSPGTTPGDQATMVDGIKHYYAQGEYIYDDWACTGTTSPTPVTGSPTDTCAQGQTLTQIAGNAVCVDTQTGEPQDPDAPCSDVVLKGSPTTNPDGSETTVTTTIKCDGTKTQTSKTTFPDGSSEEETEDQTPYDPLNPGSGPGGTGGGGTGTGTPDATAVGEGVDAGIESYCTTNPNSPICKETSSGEAASTSDLYQSKADGKTFEGVFDNFNNRIQAAPAISAATQFFDVSNLPVGSCAGLDTSFTIFGETFEVNLTDVFCSSFATELYSYLNLGVQLVATWLAFTIAFL